MIQVGSIWHLTNQVAAARASTGASQPVPGPAKKHRQCFHKWNLAMRTSKSKALQWERRDLLSRMRPKCGPNLDLLRTISRYFHQNAVKSLNSTFCDKSAMLFIMNGLLYHPISIKLHVLTLVLNLIDSSLSLFHSFAATFLS